MSDKYDLIKLSQAAIARELNVSRDTVRNRLADTDADASGCYSMVQVCDAFFGSKHQEQLKLLRIQVERNELKLKQEKRVLINTDSLCECMESGLYRDPINLPAF